MSIYASCELNLLPGFLTTFTMLARDRLSLRQMSWILVKVFFGSSVLGFVRFFLVVLW
jgi:hypothetical protein